MKKNILFATIIIVTLLFTVSLSLAAPVYIQYISPYVTPSTQQTRAITYPGHSNTYYAGQYLWAIAGKRFSAYCIDFIGNGQSFWGELVNPGIVGNGGLWFQPPYPTATPDIVRQKYMMIGYLYNVIHPTLNYVQQADLNLALWDIGLDYDGSAAPSISTGAFTATASTGMQLQVNAWLSAAYTNRFNSNNYPMIYTDYDGPAQDIIIPEPGTLLLLGSSLLGFGVIARYRRNKKA